MAIQVLIGGAGGARARRTPRIPITGKRGKEESRERKGVLDLGLCHVPRFESVEAEARGGRARDNCRSKVQ